MREGFVPIASSASAALLRDPELVANDADGMSCLHACVQMVMRARPDGRVFSFEEINKILRRKQGKYSWGYAIFEALGNEGFKVKSISNFSTEDFVRNGAAYLLDYYGTEAGTIQIANSDLPVVLDDAKRFLENGNVESQRRTPTLDDIRASIHDGGYVIPLVNSRLLKSETGYAGHFVLIYGYDETGVIFHDPGLPAQAARRMAWRDFDKAWSSPSESHRSMRVVYPL